MKSSILSIILGSLALVSSAMADVPAEICKPGSTYTVLMANSQATSLPGIGITSAGITCKVLEASGDWIKIEYTSQQMVRNATDPGQVESKTTTRTAWVNLEHVSMLIPTEGAKTKE